MKLKDLIAKLTKIANANGGDIEVRFDPGDTLIGLPIDDVDLDAELDAVVLS